MSPVTINIFFIKINSIENASAFNVGQNYLVDWTNSDKRNQGFGQNYGDKSGFIGTQSIVDDKDLIDSPSQKKSLPPGLPLLDF
ncbi:hypothetical protein IT084_04425 [Desulfallas sp. Bu1-1]|jgi:hypothetical protein|uniref:hypothetical protein n=1 Tax=Desulfallas sp. Bu1-1 TaxID=2787620 RepID=UPI0018A0855C|nr:hypothetical protein [Desulfallas sp. Bu1-1]MBF7082220.1 hypothetical protein [Desulfallas sp. Bu1-1]